MPDTPRPLSEAEAAVFDGWFGPASDGTSEAVRRAIRDGLRAAHIDALTAAVRALNQDLDSADHDSIEDGPAFAAGGRWVIEKVVNLLERP